MLVRACRGVAIPASAIPTHPVVIRNSQFVGQPPKQAGRGSLGLQAGKKTESRSRSGRLFQKASWHLISRILWWLAGSLGLQSEQQGMTTLIFSLAKEVP